MPSARACGGGTGVRSRGTSDAQVQGVQDLSQQVVELGEQAGQGAAIEEAGDRAEQVAQQVAGSGRRDDVEDDLVEADLEAQQVEVERSEHQVQDVAGRETLGRLRVQPGERLAVDLLDLEGAQGSERLLGAVGVGDDALDEALDLLLAVLLDERSGVKSPVTLLPSEAVPTIFEVILP